MQAAIDFEEVYREHYRPIYAFIRKHINIEADAEDLCATAFTMAWKAWDTYDPARCPIRAWLYIIAGNLLKNHYRDAKQTISLDGESVPEQFFSDDSFADAQRLMGLREVIAQAIEVLEERERTIIINRYFHDMKNKEIADAMSLTEGNVRVIATRALKKMQEYLKKHPEVMG